MLSPVRVGVIGCGRIAGHHCRSIAQADHVELVAVCDLIPEKVDAYATTFGVPGYLNYHEMLNAHPDINTVAVITPSGMHYEHASEIVHDYRKHVIVEKPTVLRPAHLVALFAEARALGLHVFPVFQNRYNRAVTRVRDALRYGELGAIRVVAVRVRWCRPQRYYEMSLWRGTFGQDGGALTNQGVHHVDLARHLGGEVARVNAVMRTLGVSIEVEDTVVGTMEYRNGAVGVVEVTTAARPIDFEASISFVGENGLAQIGGIAVNELQIFTPEPAACAAWSEDFSGNIYGHGHEALYRDIAATFLDGAPYPVNETDALATVRLLHAFYRSDEIGGWVDVDVPAESVRLGRPDEALAALYRTGKPESVL